MACLTKMDADSNNDRARRTWPLRELDRSPADDARVVAADVIQTITAICSSRKHDSREAMTNIALRGCGTTRAWSATAAQDGPLRLYYRREKDCFKSRGEMLGCSGS